MGIIRSVYPDDPRLAWHVFLVSGRESGYGKGWKEAGQTSKNLGAITGEGSAGHFMHRDSVPGPNGQEWKQYKFAAYATWQDSVKALGSLLKRDGSVRGRMVGTLLAVACGQYRDGYFMGFHRDEKWKNPRDYYGLTANTAFHGIAVQNSSICPPGGWLQLEAAVPPSMTMVQAAWDAMMGGERMAIVPGAKPAGPPVPLVPGGRQPPPLPTTPDPLPPNIVPVATPPILPAGVFRVTSVAANLAAPATAVFSGGAWSQVAGPEATLAILRADGGAGRPVTVAYPDGTPAKISKPDGSWTTPGAGQPPTPPGTVPAGPFTPPLPLPPVIPGTGFPTPQFPPVIPGLPPTVPIPPVVPGTGLPLPQIPPGTGFPTPQFPTPVGARPGAGDVFPLPWEVGDDYDALNETGTALERRPPAWMGDDDAVTPPAPPPPPIGVPPVTPPVVLPPVGLPDPPPLPSFIPPAPAPPPILSEEDDKAIAALLTRLATAKKTPFLVAAAGDPGPWLELSRLLTNKNREYKKPAPAFGGANCYGYHALYERFDKDRYADRSLLGSAPAPGEMFPPSSDDDFPTPRGTQLVWTSQGWYALVHLCWFERYLKAHYAMAPGRWRVVATSDHGRAALAIAGNAELNAVKLLHAFWAGSSPEGVLAGLSTTTPLARFPGP